MSFEHALDLTNDERARLASISHGYSIDRLLRFLPPDLAAHQALLDAALRVIVGQASLDYRDGGWTGGGRWLRSYAHWLLLEAFLTDQLQDMPRALEAMRWSLTGPWLAVAGKRLYGPHTDAVEELLARARTLTVAEGRRLARGWRRVDTDPLRPPWPRPPENVEPDEFEWGASFDSEMTVEAASKVPFPAELPPRDQWEFRQGIRLAAAAVAAGEPEDSALKRPWRDALTPPRSIRQRLRDLR
jgi:hypothetical protein